MTSVWLNIVLALGVLVLTGLLARQRRRSRLGGEDDSGLARGLGDGVSFSLAKRIFDPADYYWLRDRVQSPQLAKKLLCHRKELALGWLRSLKSSFNELVRAPQPFEATAAAEDGGGWVAAFLTLRFHLLIAYARCVVYFFGPYHPLVPTFGWLPAFMGLRGRKIAARIVDLDGVS